MDSRPLYPEGHHPVRIDYAPDGVYDARPLTRSQCHVRYYYIDFGISSYFPPNASPRLVLGRDGRDIEVPELSNIVPYDPFKTDIFILGNLLRREFFLVSTSDFLVSTRIANFGNRNFAM